MLKKYFLWVSLGVLGLAGCSRSERPPETAGAPVAASPVPLASSAATALATPAASGFPSAGTDTLGSPPATNSTEATRLLALLEGPRRRRSTTLAAAPEDTLAEAGPDSAAIAGLRDYLLTGLPPAQAFTIRPGRDTLLVGAQGTQVLLPADAWDLPATAATVQLVLQEFYTPADIVLAGLSTTAGPRLLETGGMLKLTATANGQPVQLRPGAFIHLRMPAQAKKTGMRLFAGVAHGSGPPLDWQEPVAVFPLTARPPDTLARVALRPRRRLRGRKMKARAGVAHASRVANPPKYVAGERRFPKSLAASIAYPQATQARLRRGRRMSRNERLELQAASEHYKERILRMVAVKFTVDSTGAVGGIEAPPGADTELVARITAALKQLPRWQPATFSEAGAVDSITAGPAARQVRVYFAESGKITVVPEEWDLKTTPFRRSRRLSARWLAWRRTQQNRRDSLFATRKGYYDSLRVVQQARASAELVRLRTQFTDTSRDAITQEGVYHELSAQGLQWINCDRYLGPGPLITFGVRTPQAGAVVTLLFQNFRSVLSGMPVSAFKTDFRSVPLGGRVVVVAIRRENGVTYLATRTASMGPLELNLLSFHPVTMAELRTALNAVQ
jgi:hypothetical protein